MSGKRWFTTILVVTTLILVGLILVDGFPLLRGPAPETSEWYWPYGLRPLARWWAPLLAAVGMWGTAVWWINVAHNKRWGAALGLVGLVLTHFLLQLSLIYADRPEVQAELVDRTLSNLASGFFEPAAEITDLNAVLGNYPQMMPTFASEHARTHPPGFIVANWLTIKAFTAVPHLSEAIARVVWPLRCTDLWLLNRPAAVAAALAFWSLLPLILAALTIVPAFLLANQLLPETASARLATALIATLPSLLLFAPKSVQIAAPLSLTALLIFHIGLIQRQKGWLFLAGLLVSINTFLSLGNMALILLFGLYFLITIYQREKAWREGLGYWTEATAFAIGVFSIWLIYWAGWNISPWAIWQTGLDQHYQLVTLQRRYLWWVISNMVDVVVFVGLPLVIGFVALLYHSIRRIKPKGLSGAEILSLSLALFLIILDLSGSSRGEVGRLWLFFLPLISIGSASFYSQTRPSHRLAALVIGLQLLLVVSLGLAWQPVRAVIVVAERPEMPSTPSPQFSLAATFSEPNNQTEIHLKGYDLTLNEPGSLGLTLYWSADRPTSRPYTVFTHLVNTHGEIIGQQDNWPVNGQWPPTCWQPGEIVVDPYHMTLPVPMPDGDYALKVGLYDAQSGLRLLTSNGQDSALLPYSINR